jgi:hypothetical protein
VRSEGLPLSVDPAEQTATRRSVALLRSKGLLRVGRPQRVDEPAVVAVSGRRGYFRVRVVARTVVGEQVVRLWGKELRSGRAIRWDRGRLEQARRGIVTEHMKQQG